MPAPSDSGAKLLATGEPASPDAVILYNIRSNLIYECEIRRCTGRHIGVQFVDVFGSTRRATFSSEMRG